MPPHSIIAGKHFGCLVDLPALTNMVKLEKVCQRVLFKDSAVFCAQKEVVRPHRLGAQPTRHQRCLFII